MKNAKNYMAVNQYGQTEHNLGPFPRKELMKRYDTKHATKIYRDTRTGTYHVGWIVRGLWFDVFEVVPMRNKA